MLTAISVSDGVTVGNGYIIVDPESATNTGGQTFSPTGPIDANTLVVIPDAKGNLPGGLTKANLPQVVAQLHSQGFVPSALGLNVATSGGTVSTTKVTPSPGVVTTQSVQQYPWSASSVSYSGNYAGDAVIGTDRNARARYYFYTAAGYNQGVAGQGKGHYRGYNGSTFGVWTTYYGLGSAGSGGAAASVPWGEVADVEGFEGRCTKTTVCWGNFSL